MRYNQLRDKALQACGLLTCLLLLLSVAVWRNHAILGHRIGTAPSVVEQTGEENETVISTIGLADDVTGYGGATPLEIHLKNGVITGVRALDNYESPDFFSRVEEKGLLRQWDGLTPQDALSKEVDAVTGATLSSRALIETMRRGLKKAAGEQVEAEAEKKDDALPVKSLAALAVILAGVVLPGVVRFRHYREVQLALNVAVLGLWSGSFLSYTALVNLLAGGMSLKSQIVIIALAVVGLLFPLFGKKGHYCAWLCPMGSLQELVGRTGKKKLRLSPRWITGLTRMRQALWCVLMVVMWTGVWLTWMDYEIFTAFLFRSAAPAVVVVAVLFLLLSVVVSRPFCRFVCPMGTLLRLSQNSEK